MTRKQSARKFSYMGQLDKGQLNSGQFEIDPSERKAALIALPLKTHIDMVTLTLDNLEMKLGVLNDAQDALSAKEFELLKRLSERLMLQKVRIDGALKTQSSLLVINS